MSPRPIAPELAPVPSRSFDAPDPPPATCAACGSYHGSVNAGRQCLEREIRRLRALLQVKP